jgi:DNA repair protein RecN (Recombination protein N)
MLTRIHIRDFAIIDELELELGPGMSVLTGETGAGKSILIDALGLVLGDRAASNTIRDGADKAEITLALDIRQLALAQQWLSEHDLETGDECLLRRVITRDGRSRAYINGSPAPLQLIRQFGEMLVDIHGQHEHQSLLRSETQREVLDAHGGNGGRLARLNECYREFRALKKQLEMLTTQGREREDRMDLLRFHVQELKQLTLGADEFDALDEEHRRLAHAGSLRDASLAAYLALYEADEDALDTHMGRIIGELETLRGLDSKLSEPIALLSEARAQLREAANGLRHYADSLDVDPQRLAWVEARLAAIHDMARKHRLAPAQLPDRLAELEAELDALESPELDLEGTRARLEEVENDYLSIAQAIHAARAATAIELSSAVTGAMQALGMAGGRFEITVEFIDEDSPSPYGLDRIEFQVSANPGQPIKPLQKVASGGELSRISLAIQIIAARSMRIPTLIFDEVDAGIGGAVAEVIGRQLRTLGERRQVLCVTHLPQVAAQAHHHYQVNKHTHKQTTRTYAIALETHARVEEIARMLGGLELTDKTRAHAQEMIGRAQACAG